MGTEILGGNENVLGLVVLFEYTESHWAIYFKKMNCIVCEFHLNKEIIKKQSKKKVGTT